MTAWDGDYDIAFALPEHVAWEIVNIIHVDSLACFSDSLVSKLWSLECAVV